MWEVDAFRKPREKPVISGLGLQLGGAVMCSQLLDRTRKLRNTARKPSWDPFKMAARGGRVTGVRGQCGERLAPQQESSTSS